MTPSLAVRKLVASAIVLAIFANAALVDAAQATFWSDRRSASRGAVEPAPRLPSVPAPAIPLSPLERLLVSLPPELGTVRSVREPSGPSKGIIVEVNDIHGNAEAQERIGRAVDALSRAGLTRVGLEGTAETLDLSSLRNTVDRADLREIAAFLARRDDISGAAGAALAADMDVSLFGIDDAALHRTNADAYLRSRAMNARFDAALGGYRRTLAARKTAAFPRDLAALDAAASDYHAGRTGLGDYLETMSASAGNASGNVALFLDALRLERKLDTAAVERERRALLERLSSRATRAQLSDLLARTASFRTGRLASGAYYAFVRDLCAAAGVPLKNFPAMDAYVHYVSLSDRVDGGALLDEASALERRAFDAHAATPALRALVAETRWTTLAAKLRDFSLTRAEWRDYAALPRPAGAPDAAVLAPYEDFYRAAEKRDAALAANANRLMAAPGGVIVAGGFHGDSLRRRLVAAGWTVVDFTPRVTKADGEAGGYLSVFAREKTPIEKLFSGEKLFLKNDPMPAAVRNGLIPAAALALRALRGRTEGALAFLRRAAPTAPVDGADVVVDGPGHATVTVTRGSNAVAVAVTRRTAIESITQTAVAPRPMALVLPMVKWTIAWIMMKARQRQGIETTLASALIDVEIASHSPRFRVYLIPLLELIGLPGLAMALAAPALMFLPGIGIGYIFAATAITGGFGFAALHDIAGLRQTNRQFLIRGAAASTINAAALMAFVVSSGFIAFITALAMAYFLHALWNLRAPAAYELAINDARPHLLRNAVVRTASGEGVVLPVRMEQAPLPISNEEARRLGQRILDIAARRQTAGTQEQGRSIVAALETPITVDGVTFDSVVLKRVTYRGQPPSVNEWRPDDREEIDQPMFVLRTDHANRVFMEPLWRRATGTGRLSENLYEYREMRRAFRAGVPTGYPFAVGEFLSLKVDGSPTGFIAYLDNAAARAPRLGDALRARTAPLRSARSMDQIVPVVENAMAFLADNAGRAARELARANDAGIIHRSPHTSQYGLPDANGRVHMYDWDDAVWAGRLTRDEYIFTRFNDFLQFYYAVHQLANRANPGMPVVDYYRMFLRMAGARNPLDESVVGYFSTEQIDRVGQKRLADTFRAQSPMPYMRFWEKFGDAPTPFSELDPGMWQLAQDLFGPAYDQLIERQVIAPLAAAGLPADAVRIHFAALHDWALASNRLTARDVTRELRGTQLRRGWANQIAGAISSFTEIPPTRPTLLMAPAVAALAGARAESRWFQIFAVPAIEGPGLPGFALALLPILAVVSPTLAPGFAALLAGLVFAAIHGLPGRGQSLDLYVIRAGASTAINAAALLFFLNVGGAAGLVAAFLVGYALHAGWNAAVPEAELAAGGWKRRLTRILEHLAADTDTLRARSDLARMFRTQFDDQTHPAAWQMITRAIPGLPAAERASVSHMLVSDILSSTRDRGNRRNAFAALDALLRTSLPGEPGRIVWNEVIRAFRSSPVTARALYLPIILPVVFARAADPSTRTNALSDLADIVTVELDSPRRQLLRRTLYESLEHGPEGVREAMPYFLLAYARRNPGADGEMGDIYRHLSEAAADSEAPSAVRANSINALLDLLAVSDWLHNSFTDHLAEQMFAILAETKGTDEQEIRTAAFIVLEHIVQDVRDLRRRHRAAVAIIELIDIVNGVSVADRVATLTPLYRLFSDESDRRAMLRAVIDRLKDWETAFAARPEAMGEIGNMLATWLKAFPDDAHDHELAVVADHVVRFYPRVGAIYAGLLSFLENWLILTPQEAQDRLPFAHWDLHPSFLQRDPINAAINDRLIQVLGRLQGPSPGLTIVQRPLIQLQFRHSAPGEPVRYGPSLPGTYDLSASTVFQKGRSLVYYPARLVGEGIDIELMVLLGEAVYAKNDQDDATYADTITEETPTPGRTLIRSWTPWKIPMDLEDTEAGQDHHYHFRRPGVAVFHPKKPLVPGTTLEPLVIPFGHSADLKTAYYLFPETNVIYSIEVNNDQRLQDVRQTEAAAQRSGVPSKLESEQQTLATRNQIVQDLATAFHRLPDADRERYSLFPRAVTHLVVSEIHQRNRVLYDLIFGNRDTEDIKVSELFRLFAAFMRSRHGNNPAYLATLGASLEAVLGGTYVPSLNAVLTDEGRTWMMTRLLEMVHEKKYTPLPDAVARDAAAIDAAGGLAAIPDGFPAANRLFAWASAPASTTRIDYLERLQMTPGELFEATFATSVRLVFRGDGYEFVPDVSNEIPAHELGTLHRLGEALMTPRIHEYKPRPTYIQVTVANKPSGRTVFPGNAGDKRTVRDVLESVRLGIGSRKDVKKITLVRPGTPNRGVTQESKVLSGDSLIVELKPPKKGGTGSLLLVANIGVASLAAIGLAVLLAAHAIVPAASATFAATAGLYAATAIGMVAAAVLFHEGWHALFAWIVYAFGRSDGRPGLDLPWKNGGKSIGVSFGAASPGLQALTLLAPLSAIPLSLLAFLALPSGDLTSIALAAVALVNAAALVPLEHLALRVAPVLASRLPLRTDGDALLDLLPSRATPRVRAHNSDEAIVAKAVADGIEILSKREIDRDAFADAIARVGQGTGILFGLDKADGRGMAVAGGDLNVDTYAAALRAELEARRLPVSLDGVRAGLQNLSFAGASSRSLDYDLVYTDLVENQANVAVLSPAMKPAEEARLVELLLMRETTFKSKVVFVAADEAQRERIERLAGTRGVVLLGAGVLGNREGRDTVEMAALVAQLTGSKIDLSTYGRVRFLTPAGRTVVMDGLASDLPWMKEALVVMIDETLRAVDVSMPTLQAIETTARLVSQQA